MNKYKGIIFDLDGVLVDTAKFHYVAWRKMANTLGFDIDLEQNEKLKGVSRIHSLEQILTWGNKAVSKEEFEMLMANKNKDYLASIASMSKEDLLPGVDRVLKFLTANNIPMALGSASKNARSILKNLNIYERFAAIVDGNDVIKAKPNPEVFLLAAEKLEVRPEECIVFEDAFAGVIAANSAGMLSIGIGDRDILKDADHNFRDFTEIELEFIEQFVLK